MTTRVGSLSGTLRTSGLIHSVQLAEQIRTIRSETPDTPRIRKSLPLLDTLEANR